MEEFHFLELCVNSVVTFSCWTCW